MRLNTLAICLTLLLTFSIGLLRPPAQGQKKTPTDWPTFGNDPGGQRYAPLTQINSDNVTKLARAWTYHMKPAGAAPPGAESGPPRRSNLESQAVPLVVNGVMYLTRLIAASSRSNPKRASVCGNMKSDVAKRRRAVWNTGRATRSHSRQLGRACSSARPTAN